MCNIHQYSKFTCKPPPAPWRKRATNTNLGRQDEKEFKTNHPGSQEMEKIAKFSFNIFVGLICIATCVEENCTSDFLATKQHIKRLSSCSKVDVGQTTQAESHTANTLPDAFGRGLCLMIQLGSQVTLQIPWTSPWDLRELPCYQSKSCVIKVIRHTCCWWFRNPSESVKVGSLFHDLLWCHFHTSQLDYWISPSNSLRDFTGRMNVILLLSPSLW